MTNLLKCPKCAAEMREGYILEVADGNVRSAALWIGGKPERSFFFGTKLKDKEQHPIQSFRCVACGYLESYASAD
jgi:predicted nucleic-acid-binding Zn-ribbon protein